MSSISTTILIGSIFVCLKINFTSACNSDIEPCTDWTLCARVSCFPAPETCPEETPYRLLGHCGCCEFCSACPRKGPCGTCGKDVKCKESYPSCGQKQILTIDDCGCCRVCKDKKPLGEGQACQTEVSQYICNPGLLCINGICSKEL